MKDLIRGVLRRGVPVSAAGMLCMALLLTLTDLPFTLYRICAAIPLLCGCFCAGRYAGKRLRHRGMYWGLLSALLLTALWYLAVLIRQHSPALPTVLPLALPCGMCGGVCGVNKREPEPRPSAHRGISLRERTLLRLKMRHRPPKK